MISDKLFQNIFDDIIRGMTHAAVIKKYGKQNFDAYVERVDKACNY